MHQQKNYKTFLVTRHVKEHTEQNAEADINNPQ